MGTVYVARDRVLDRDVAVKVLDVADQSGARAARLPREAHILARLDHPGIVPVHDAGTLPDGRAFYVMKLVKGRAARRVSSAQALRSLADRPGTSSARMLDAVAFAHAHGIVHRDLKPENIMVGAFGEVLVMDWGVAQDGPARMREAAVVGTPGFMPPEQERRRARVDARADVFALGAMLARLLASRAAAARRDRREGAATPTPARYQNVAALAADLARFRDREPVEAYRESIGERALRVYRRYELPDPAAAGVRGDAVRIAGFPRHLDVHTRHRDVESFQEERMKKPVFATLLGGILGAFDGLSALISAPETRPLIAGIVAGSTFKGLVLGLIVGLVAQRTQSAGILVGLGLALGAFFAYLVTLQEPYFWEIILPGSIVGLIVGFATAKYRGPQTVRATRFF